MSQHHNTCGVGNTILLLLAAAALLAAPRVAGADVVIIQPTGTADGAFLASLEDALRSAIAEAPEANGIDAELRATASPVVNGVEISLELVPKSVGKSIREKRTASPASALAQARAMARAVVKAFAEGPPQSSEPPAPNKASPGATTPPPPTERRLRAIEAAQRRTELRRRTVAAIFLPATVYLAGSLLPIGLTALASEDSCWSSCVEEDQSPPDWRGGAEDVFSLPILWILGAATVIPASILTTVIYNRASTFRTSYWASLLGGMAGLALDIGLCALLYHTTQSAGALIAPTIAGYIVLPQFGSVLGARLSRKNVSMNRAAPGAGSTRTEAARVSILPPVPTAFATRDGAAPGLALGGTF